MKRYRIIYADPPWKYRSEGLKNASRHYKCLDTEIIYRLPIQKISHRNCILLLWVTFPMLPEGLETIKQWGFKYATTAFVWVKANPNYDIHQRSYLPVETLNVFTGCGNHTRANAELCLLGRRGKAVKRRDLSVKQIIYSPVWEHSRKPDEARQRIVKLYGNVPRVELFARQRVAGWDAWGNEVKSDIKMRVGE